MIGSCIYSSKVVILYISLQLNPLYLLLVVLYGIAIVSSLVIKNKMPYSLF